MTRNGVESDALTMYLQPHVTLTLTSWSQKLAVSCPFLVNHLCQLASKSALNLFSKYHVHKFANGPMVGQTNRQTKNVMLLPASLAW